MDAKAQEADKEVAAGEREVTEDGPRKAKESEHRPQVGPLTADTEGDVVTAGGHISQHPVTQPVVRHVIEPMGQQFVIF